MIDIKHKPTPHDDNSYRIVGDDIEELVEESLKRVRPISKKFYTTELRKDLEFKGESLIDRHAGMGNFYKIMVIK